MATITKSPGLNPTEKLLSELCDGTFLNLWSYPNPFREPGKELCDLIAVFENHVYLFFTRETNSFLRDTEDFGLAWERWKKEAVTKQIKSAKKARTHVLRSRDKVYLDAAAKIPMPVKIPDGDIVVHTIIVAHGAADACKMFAADNVSGSLAIIYTDNATNTEFPFPFVISLERSEAVHLLDSHTVEIMLRELDTFYDFTNYIVAKETAIARYDSIMYAGEEDLLAHYYHNFDDKTELHFIGVDDAQYNGIIIPEGGWRDFIESRPYKDKKAADKTSYLWDELIQRTTQNALDGTLLGDGIFASHSAIFEMAKEPRFMRREFAKRMLNAIGAFPDNNVAWSRHVCFMPSFTKTTAYIFLQARYRGTENYDTYYRPKRQALLEIACGAARNKFSHLTKIVGIAVDAIRFASHTSEDFLLMHCADWPDNLRKIYAEQNKAFQFFESPSLKMDIVTSSNFPKPSSQKRKVKIGPNDPCPCGSNKKYKKCHGPFAR